MLRAIARRIAAAVRGGDGDPGPPPGMTVVTLSDYLDGSGRPWIDNPTATACVSRIASTLAAMPRHVVSDAGGAPERQDHPLNAVLARPSRLWDGSQTWEMLYSRMIAAGNGFMAIERDGRGRPAGLLPGWDGTGEWWTDASGDRHARWRIDLPIAAGPPLSATLPDSDVIHVHGPGFDGLRSPSPIARAARLAIATSRAGQEHLLSRISDAFGSLVIESEAERASDAGVTREMMQDQAARIAGAVRQAKTEGKAIVMPGGWKLRDRSIVSPTDLKLLEVLQFDVEEICRTFSVPPRMVGHYSSGVRVEMKVGSQAEDYYRFGVLPWQRRVEDQLTAKLLTAGERGRGLRVALRDAEVRRGSAAEQIEMAARAYSGAGIATLNEARALAGWPRRDDGDRLSPVVVGGGGPGGRPPESESEQEGE